MIILLQLFGLIWLIGFVPYNIIVMLRSLIYDRNYTYGFLDAVSGLSITVLVLYGTPPLIGFIKLKTFLGY